MKRSEMLLEVLFQDVILSSILGNKIPMWAI